MGMSATRRAGLVVFLVVLAGGQLAVGMRASRTAPITGDEPFYLLATQSLLSDGDLDTTDEYENREYEPFWDSEVDLWRQMVPDEDGVLLVPHDPGLSLIVLPAYAAWGLRGAQRFLVVLWAAAMAIAAAVACRLLPGRESWAALAGVVVGIGTPGIVYASQLYPEGPAALGVALGLLLLTADPKGWTRGWRGGAALAAVITGLAWLGTKYALVGAVVLVAFAWRRRRDDRVALVVGAVLLAVSATVSAWWHLRVFGGLTPYSTNIVYAGEGTAQIVDSHLRLTGRGYRTYGLFLDARFGLFRWLPVAVLGLWGVGRRTAAAAGVLAAGVVLGSFVSITIMGWWFPGRMLVAGFPGLVVLVAAGADRWPRIAVVLSAWSVCISVATVLSARTGGIRLAVDPFDLGFPLAWRGLFPDFRQFGAQEILLSLAWAVALGVIAIGTRRRPTRASAGDIA